MSRVNRKKSAGTFPWIFAVAAGVSAGYVLYRSLSRDSGRKNPGVGKRRVVSGQTQSQYMVRRKQSGGTMGGAVGNGTEGGEQHVSWLPGLRVREQKILNSMPLKKEVRMSQIIRHFPAVTVRTLRRDMDRLVAKGKIKRVGATRSTTYVKV